MRFAQILKGKAHWIFEAEAMPEFAPDIVIVDITHKPEVQEGWVYNEETGDFTAPILPTTIVEPTIEEQIYAESLYQTALLEIQMLGGV